MIVRRRAGMAALVLLAAAGPQSDCAEVTYENGADGIQYRVTKQIVPRHVAIPETRPQQQTTYRQQVTTENVPHQQMYSVPVTQYQVVSQLHGRWNPFVTPYWTHHYQPVTVWQQQAATVQIPVTRVAWAPETQTVQQAVTTWKTVNEEIVYKTPIGPVPAGGGSNTAMASARPLNSSSPSATLSSSPSGATPLVAQRSVGGQAMQGDPPRQPASGWQPPSTPPAAPRY